MVKIHQMNLKFVSCGKAEKDGLAFKQLTSIFDVATWVSIALSTIGGSPVTLFGDTLMSFINVDRGKVQGPRTFHRSLTHPSQLYYFIYSVFQFKAPFLIT